MTPWKLKKSFSRHFFLSFLLFGQETSRTTTRKTRERTRPHTAPQDEKRRSETRSNCEVGRASFIALPLKTHIMYSCSYTHFKSWVQVEFNFMFFLFFIYFNLEPILPNKNVYNYNHNYNNCNKYIVCKNWLCN